MCLWNHTSANMPVLNFRPMANFQGCQYHSVGRAWATDNTHKVLFDAMEREQVYAATVPRMVVRSQGGGEFVGSEVRGRLPAAVDCTKGV